MARRIRHLLSIEDLSDEELRHLVRRGAEFAAGRSAPAALTGCVVGLYFRRTSTRTRTAFSSGALRLGGQIVSYGPHDLQENTGESTEDTGRVLSGMLDAFVARTAGSPEELRALADQERMAVVNAMSADEHPTQAVCDLTAMTSHFGAVAPLRVLYVGEGNNTAAALALALARYPGAVLRLRTPPGYGLAAEKAAAAAARAAASGAVIEERHTMDDLPPAVDVVYTTRWQTTGTAKADPDWRTTFDAYRVDERLMGRYPDAVFMHDLPAHRGEEVTGGVLDSARSIAFQQAEHKLHSAIAVLEWCLCG